MVMVPTRSVLKGHGSRQRICPILFISGIFAALNINVRFFIPEWVPKVEGPKADMIWGTHLSHLVLAAALLTSVGQPHGPHWFHSSRPLTTTSPSSQSCFTSHSQSYYMSRVMSFLLPTHHDFINKQSKMRRNCI